MKLFRNTSVFNALNTFVRMSDEGGATDSRAAQARALIAAGPASQAVYDSILEGFVSDPATFAAAVSGIAGASLPPAAIEALLEAKSVKALRKLAKGFDAATIKTEDSGLRAFLDEAARCDDVGKNLSSDAKVIRDVIDGGPDGHAWTMLVAGHLSLLRADRGIRAFIYPKNR